MAVSAGSARLSLIVAAVTALLGAAGCGTPEPSGSSADASVPFGCFGVPADACRAIAERALVVVAADGLVPTYVWVQLMGCPVEPCADRFGPGARALAIVDVAVGEPRHAEAEAIAGGIGVSSVEADWPYSEREPRSAAGAASGPTPLSLGHCGIASGIDFDGSLWDPVGSVEYGASEAINSADGTIRLTSPTTAVFSTPSGFRLDLVRHHGLKFVPACM